MSGYIGLDLINEENSFREEYKMLDLEDVTTRQPLMTDMEI